MEPGGGLAVLVFSDEQIKTIASVFPYTARHCSMFILASTEPIRLHRSVEEEMTQRFGSEFSSAVAERRTLCGLAEPDGATFNKRVPILEDATPVVEFRLGRSLWSN